MKSEDLRLEELVAFSEGSLSLHGRRLVLHDMHAFAQFRKDLVDMVGLEHARRILTRFGYFWGQTDAAAMKRIFEWESTNELMRASARMHSLEGITRAVVRNLRIDEKAASFFMEVLWHESGEAEEHLREIGRAQHPS